MCPWCGLLEQSIEMASDSEAAATAERHLDVGLEVEMAERLIALQKKQSLASHFDLRAARKLRDTSDERRLQPRFVEGFFMRAWAEAGGAVTADKTLPCLARRSDADRDAGGGPASTRLPVAEKYETPFVFDKELVSVASKVRVPEYTRLLGPGHPLFDALIEWAVRRSRTAFTQGVTLVDPNISRPGRMWLVRSTIQDGRHEEKKRLAHEQISVVVADHLGLRSTSAANLLNYTAPESPVERLSVPEHSPDGVQSWAYEHLTEHQYAVVRDLRQAECDLRRRYLETTFTELILDLQDDLNDLAGSRAAR